MFELSLYNALFFIIFGAVGLYITFQLLSAHFKTSQFFKSSDEKLLDKAAHEGLIISAKIVTMDASADWERETDEFKRYKNRHSRNGSTKTIDLAISAINNIPDGRVSYQPVLEYKVGGKKYTARYFRYISSREMNLKDGQTVRIIYKKSNPNYFIIHGDKAAYSYLPQIFV